MLWLLVVFAWLLACLMIINFVAFGSHRESSGTRLWEDEVDELHCTLDDSDE